MATRSYSCRETVTNVLIYLLLLVMATPTKGKINGSNTSNYSATASDLGLPKGLTVLVRGEQNTVEVGWEPATDVIGNTSFILLLTSQVNGEKIAYREVGGGGMEGRVTLSGIQLGEAYSLTVYSTDGRLNSSEALTFTIQPGSSDAFACPYLEVLVVILALVILAVVAAASLIVCIACVRKGRRGAWNKTGSAKGLRKDRKSTASHTSKGTIGSRRTVLPSGGHRASLEVSGLYNASSHAYDSLEYNTYVDLALEENPAYNAHEHAHNDGDDPYVEANPAYNLSIGQVQKGDHHQQGNGAEVDYVPLEANPAYNLPVPAHMDDLSSLLQSNAAKGPCTGGNMSQDADPVMQDNPAYIHTIQSPTSRVESGDGGYANESLYILCESQATNYSDVTLEENPAYEYLPSQGLVSLPSNKSTPMHQPSEARNNPDSSRIPLQDNPSYYTASHLMSQQNIPSTPAAHKAK